MELYIYTKISADFICDCIRTVIWQSRRSLFPLSENTNNHCLFITIWGCRRALAIYISILYKGNPILLDWSSYVPTPRPGFRLAHWLHCKQQVGGQNSNQPSDIFVLRMRLFYLDQDVQQFCCEVVVLKSFVWIRKKLPIDIFIASKVWIYAIQYSVFIVLKVSHILAFKFFISAVDNNSIHEPRLFNLLNAQYFQYFDLEGLDLLELSNVLNNQVIFGICVLEYAIKHMH